MPRVQNVQLGGGQQAMLVTTVGLTAAQIRALGTTHPTLVQAPGAGMIIVPLGFAVFYSFGTKPFLFVTGGSDKILPAYSPSLDGTGTEIDNQITRATSCYFYTGTFPGPNPILPGDDNQAIVMLTASDYTNGPIATTTLGAGGLAYLANDTGTISTGSADATYKVLTVGAGGAVLTFQITGAGTSYATGNGVATATGGAQPGVGAGFTVNITAVTQGDGTLKVVTYYQIVPVP